MKWKLSYLCGILLVAFFLPMGFAIAIGGKSPFGDIREPDMIAGSLMLGIACGGLFCVVIGFLKIDIHALTTRHYLGIIVPLCIVCTALIVYAYYSQIILLK